MNKQWLALISNGFALILTNSVHPTFFLYPLNSWISGRVCWVPGHVFHIPKLRETHRSLTRGSYRFFCLGLCVIVMFLNLLHWFIGCICWCLSMYTFCCVVRCKPISRLVLQEHILLLAYVLKKAISIFNKSDVCNSCVLFSFRSPVVRFWSLNLRTVISKRSMWRWTKRRHSVGW